MNSAFYIGATGLRAQEHALGVTANNIANLNTPGFKRARVRFGELVGAAPATAELAQAARIEASGVAALGAGRVMEQGELRVTGQAMDLGVDGDGFFEVLGPEGQSLLWRGGALEVGVDGLLGVAGGFPLRALITVPAGASQLRISPDGTVTAQLGGDEAATELGRLDLVSVNDPAKLVAAGAGLWRAGPGQTLTAATPGEEGAGLIIQGAFESSNVELSEEMVALMVMQRAYAASAQVLQAGDQLMGIANGLRR